MKRIIVILVMVLGIAIFASEGLAEQYDFFFKGTFARTTFFPDNPQVTAEVAFKEPVTITSVAIGLNQWKEKYNAHYGFKIFLGNTQMNVAGPFRGGAHCGGSYGPFPYNSLADKIRIFFWSGSGYGSICSTTYSYISTLFPNLQKQDIKLADGAKNIGKISSLVSDDTTGITGITVSSKNIKVMIWVGKNTDYTRKTTTTISDDVWACLDADADKNCDFLQKEACIKAGWEWTDKYMCVDDKVCKNLGGTWVSDQKKCCDNGDNFPGCVNGKVRIDSDGDGIEDINDKCKNTKSTEIGSIITDPSSQYYGCSTTSEVPICVREAEGAVCQSGPLCATDPVYNAQENNTVCKSMACDASSQCSVKKDCTPCPVQDCNQKDSYLVGCYEDSSGIKREYRDYIERYEVCEQGVCVAKTCEYTVVDPGVLKDFDKDKIPNFCDTDPCGQNTFFGSSTLETAGCFCKGNFTDCDQDISNGCERDASPQAEGACPGISKCTIPFTTKPLASGQTCIGPASEKVLGGMVCKAGQYFCYGLCRDVSCDTPTELCKDPKDYDCDGLPNDYEFKYGLAVFDPIDKDHDPDSDGLINIREFKYLTNPFDPDTDEDKLTDLEEIDKTNPLEPDTDKDGLIDGDEVLTYITDPQLQDTDKDGLFDGDEIQAIIDWLGIVDKKVIASFVKEDGCKNYCLGEEIGGPDEKNNGPRDLDTDGDGLSDLEEVKGIKGLMSNPFDPENKCSFECSSWEPDPCEEGQTQTRTCSKGVNCEAAKYKPKESQACRPGFTGLEEKVPFFTTLNIIATLVIIIGYYLVTLRKKNLD